MLPGTDALLNLFDLTHPEESIPPRVAILIGEVVYNFRAALDYAVGALSRSDTPIWSLRQKRRNQFPVERTAQGFDARRDTFLGGLTDAHVDAIRAYQPYAGCAWTARLADLSNRDKHNDLVVVVQGLTINVRESDIDDELVQPLIPAVLARPA